MTPIKMYDVVRVKRLLREPESYICGSAFSKRPPRVGDQGSVVMLYSMTCTVEAVEPDGCTLWLSDFAMEELEHIAEPNP